MYALDQDQQHTSSLGIFNLLRKLFAALAQCPDPAFRMVILASDSSAPLLVPACLPPWMEVRLVRGRHASGWRRLWADHVMSVRWAMANHVDVLHYPKGFLPLFCPPSIKMIASLHDTIVDYYAVHYPGYFPRTKIGYFRWATRHSLRKASRIMTLSHFSRDCLLRILPEAAPRMEVVSPSCGLPDPSEVVRCERKGILVIGSAFPHKATLQTLRLLEQYACQRGAPLDIVVTGLASLPCAAHDAPHNLNIRLAGRVSDEEMSRLMACSGVALLLSEIEGFGLPLLECYARGTPVCYRNTNALAEVMAGHPGGWDGRDAVGFNRALDEARSLSSLDIERIRDDLLSRYDWNNTARKVLSIYRKALE